MREHPNTQPRIKQNPPPLALCSTFCRTTPRFRLVLEDKHSFKVWCEIQLPSSTATMASSSSVSVFDNYRFKIAFNEELYNSIVKNKKVIAECCIDLDENEYPEVKEQISLRGWRRLAAPKQEISIDLIHEFYA
ncbi:hypothetical protein PIB30_102529, partial [Stylosanthes scabra]|nr:hypothetical protein [Stylosanthes scabra]